MGYDFITDICTCNVSGDKYVYPGQQRTKSESIKMLFSYPMKGKLYDGSFNFPIEEKYQKQRKDRWVTLYCKRVEITVLILKNCGLP